MKLPFIRITNWADFRQTFDSKKHRDTVFANLQKMVATTPFNELGNETLWPSYDDDGLAEFEFKDYKDGAYYFEYITTIK